MIKIIQYNDNVVESPFILANYAFVSTNSIHIPVEYKFVSINSNAYTVMRSEKITDNYIHTYGSIIEVKQVKTFVAFNVKNISDQLHVEIIESKSCEIDMQVVRNEIHSVLCSLCLTDKQIVETPNYKLHLFAPKQNSYFMIDKTTNIHLVTSKYKLYDTIQKVPSCETVYGSIKIASPSSNNVLNPYIIFNTDEIKRNALFKLNPVYVGKKIMADSSKTTFEITINELSCDVLSDTTICFLSDYTFSFINADPNIVVCSNLTMHAPTQLDIGLIEITQKYSSEMNTNETMVYKMDDVTKNIIKLFGTNKQTHSVIKLNDVYEMRVNDSILKFNVKAIHTQSSNSAKVCFYKPPLNISFCIFSNPQKSIYVMEEPLLSNIIAMDVQISLGELRIQNPHLNDENVIIREQQVSLIESEIRKIKNIMSYNLEKRIQLTITDSSVPLGKLTNKKEGSKGVSEAEYVVPLNAKIINISTNVDYSCKPTLLYMNDKTQINIYIDPEDTRLTVEDEPKTTPCVGLTRNDLKNIKTKLESYGMGGMDDQIKILTKELFLPRTNFMPKGLLNIMKPTRGVILYGPPGTGKTTLARNIGKLLNIPHANINMITSTEVLNKFIGESEENIRNMFEPSRKNPNELHLLVIDEIDAILCSRQNQTELRNSIVNQFLGEMDGLNQVSNILVIGITNRLDMLDSAVLRPGRFSCLIKCDLPNTKSRKQILELYVNKMSAADIFISEVDLDILAEKTYGFSGADIEYVFNCLVDNLAQYLFDLKESSDFNNYNVTHQQVLDIILEVKNRKS
jgi:ATP-dependent 26S proteasome regulatory subunit